MTQLLTKTLIALGAIASLAGTAGIASAATPWQIHHPHRVEVNLRADRLDHRIAMERREHELTRGQARDLRREDAGIRAQERFDASRDRSHLTRAEDRRLNREENGLNRQLRP